MESILEAQRGPHRPTQGEASCWAQQPIHAPELSWGRIEVFSAGQ